MNDGDGFFSGMLVGVIFMGLIGIFVLCAFSNSMDKSHQQAVFQEQVEHHSCKIKPYWENGKETTGNICVLPDGTIIKR
jgi:hypothetical protein